MDLGEEDHRDKGSFSSYPIEGTHYQHDMSLVRLMLAPRLDCPSPHDALFHRKFAVHNSHRRVGVGLHIVEGRVFFRVIWNST